MTINYNIKCPHCDKGPHPNGSQYCPNTGIEIIQNLDIIKELTAKIKEIKTKLEQMKQAVLILSILLILIFTGLILSIFNRTTEDSGPRILPGETSLNIEGKKEELQKLAGIIKTYLQNGGVSDIDETNNDKEMIFKGNSADKSGQVVVKIRMDNKPAPLPQPVKPGLTSLNLQASDQNIKTLSGIIRSYLENSRVSNIAQETSANVITFTGTPPDKAGKVTIKIYKESPPTDQEAAPGYDIASVDRMIEQAKADIRTEEEEKREQLNKKNEKLNEEIDKLKNEAEGNSKTQRTLKNKIYTEQKRRREVEKKLSDEIKHRKDLEDKIKNISPNNQGTHFLRLPQFVKDGYIKRLEEIDKLVLPEGAKVRGELNLVLSIKSNGKISIREFIDDHMDISPGNKSDAVKERISNRIESIYLSAPKKEIVNWGVRFKLATFSGEMKLTLKK